VIFLLLQNHSADLLLDHAVIIRYLLLTVCGNHDTPYHSKLGVSITHFKIY